VLGDLKVIGREAGNRHGQAILVLARLLDVVGRPVVDRLDARGVLQQIEDMVEADARPEQRREVVIRSHNHILQ
jgi:hypothetical protein